MMAAGVYNVALNAPAISDLRVMLLVGYTADVDHATLAAVVAAASGEATFTNYARKALSSEAWSVDNATNIGKLDAADPATWTAAGGTVDNLVSHAVVYQHVDGTDANDLPVSFHTVGVTTNGGDLTVAFAAAGIFTTTQA